MYDVKSTFEKAKAMVLNYTEMEAKVHEATNGDAWGASSTLMQEIAAGTFNFQVSLALLRVPLISLDASCTAQTDERSSQVLGAGPGRTGEADLRSPFDSSSTK